MFDLVFVNNSSLTPPTGNLSPSILMQSSAVAPMSVFLNVGDISGSSLQVTAAPAGAHSDYDPEKHQLTCIWTVRNNPLSYERAPHLNMPDEWKNANVYYGHSPTIVFSDPGTYEVDLTVVDMFNNVDYASSPMTFTVGSADAAFPGGATIVVSDSSDFTGAPAGATTIDLNTDTEADINTALLARNDADTRLLFKRGIDFRGDITPGTRFSFYQLLTSEMEVGAFGTGAKPIIPLCPVTGASSESVFDAPADGTGTIKVNNLDLRGAYDPTRERGYQGGTPVYYNVSCNILYHRNLISGQAIITTQSRAGNYFFVWSDGEIKDWMDMGLFQFRNDSGGTRRCAILGSDIHQNAQARSGGGGKSGTQNTHGPVRLEESDDVYLSAVDLFSCTGWSGADQPCLRINTEGRAGGIQVDRVACEGGWQVINNTSENSAAPDHPENTVIDKLLTIGTAQTNNRHIHGHHGGITIRNHKAVEFNAPKGGTGGDYIYRFDFDNTSVSENLDTPLRLYNNSALSLLSSANNGSRPNISLLSTVSFTDVTSDNNLFYAPNQDTPDTTTPLDVSTPMTGGRSGFSAVTPRYEGRGTSLTHIDRTGDGTNVLRIPYSALLDKNGAATDQAFWQARPVDALTSHTTRDSNGLNFSDLGQLTVVYDPTEVVITRASGVFPNGGNVVVKLDQSDTLDPIDATSALTGFTMPTMRAVADTDVDSSTLVAADDFYLDPKGNRGLTGAPSAVAHKGASE